MDKEGGGGDEAQDGEGGAEVAAVLHPAKDLRADGAHRHAHRVHEAVGGGAEAARDELAQDGHVVRVEHAVADAEEWPAATAATRP